MAIEAVFGYELGNLMRPPESTILASRLHEELPETSLLAWGRGLCDLLTGMASACSTFALAHEGNQFYFLLIVRPSTLHLDIAQVVHVNLGRTRRVTVREQMATAAARIACQLADLGTPAWLETAPTPGPRQPARLDAADLL